MKSLTSFLGSVSMALFLVGCGGSDAPSEAKPAAEKQMDVATKPMTDRETTPDVPANVVKEQAMTVETATKMSEFKVPDLTSVGTDKLGKLSADALTGLGAMAGSGSPALMGPLNALKESLTSEDPLKALGQLKDLAVAAQQIPGAATAIESTKTMVSAWALKQGFDPATLNPILGSLQQGDLAGLASQASKLIGTGELTDQQMGLLNGVLSNYGIDAQAADAVKAVKGLFNR